MLSVVWNPEQCKRDSAHSAQNSLHRRLRKVQAEPPLPDGATPLIVNSSSSVLLLLGLCEHGLRAVVYGIEHETAAHRQQN